MKMMMIINNSSENKDRYTEVVEKLQLQHLIYRVESWVLLIVDC